MSSLQNTPAIFKNPIVNYILFWLGVYTYFVGTVNMNYYSGYGEVLGHYIIYIGCQIIVAYTCLYVLIPRFLTPKKNVPFVLSLLLLLAFVFVIFVGYHEYYHLPKYAKPSQLPYDSRSFFWKKILDFRIFIGKSTIILTPTALLVIAKFYKEKQTYLQLNEQKKATELSALKHQLNPHFLFNTLNNLYALAINKSDETPEVIAKLSEMLDYMLYGCNNKYVPLFKEIDLIENYLALEKVRYGNRVEISFNKDIQPEAKIAPLILLTFIENAFKHGVSQELKRAFIHITITVERNLILFTIENSIAKNTSNVSKKVIGLNNVKKQLELLYLDTYSLKIKEENQSFNVDLKLPIK
ncbi:sensor histidine kinase [Tenacibaculum caenipelagi]|uniref:Histidine kinase n=1 Tax=Tenacibaculum caenipelagi TaxID=1325435 RepID=A0A4R6TGP2_9FLAO|nr:sensor histidine kinase [Tenacibaculum caenipelagi]TDQ27462.1 histidine kinase [Tenacibaculum caenipelagi]